MEGKITYAFSSTVWQHAATGGWYFVSLPKAISAEIRQHLKWQEEGWGRIKAEAKIRKSQWQTAIWFDSKHQTYLLPIKAEIRKKESIEKDQSIRVQVYI